MLNGLNLTANLSVIHSQSKMESNQNQTLLPFMFCFEDCFLVTFRKFNVLF